MSEAPQTPEHYHFVTGKLAEESLRRTVAPLADAHGFGYTIDVLGISVAALMTPDWVARHMRHVPEATRVLLPGYCGGDLRPIESRTGLPVARGPKDLRRLPEYFGADAGQPAEYGSFDIEILAEINHASRLPRTALIEAARRLVEAGADVIDLGCTPGEPWSAVGDAVRALRGEGWRVSIDSMLPREIAPAVDAGAELVLSVNSSNVHAAADWGCEVVAVPDVPATLQGLNSTLDRLVARSVRFRIDPILEPIGFGFSASLERYLRVRREYPDAEMLMGIGNLTELTDADSAPMNVLLLGFCQELGIRSVLTTQVIPWARSCVRECDLARRLVHFAVTHHVLPKHLDPRLVVLRDPFVPDLTVDDLDRLASRLKDPNIRLFAGDGALHAVTAGHRWSDADPFTLLEKMVAESPRPIDPSHAFYLGYELAKASIALTLGKDYRQDESLEWGFLTRHERSGPHRGEPPDDTTVRP